MKNFGNAMKRHLGELYNKKIWQRHEKMKNVMKK